MEDSYYRYWGKARPGAEGEAPYHLLVYHSLDVAAVGKILLQKHHFLRRRLASLMQLPEAVATDWCVFLLGIHDLGKFAETFQQLRFDLREELWPGHSVRLTNYIRHDSLGNVLWQNQLEDHFWNQQPDLADFIEEGVMSLWLSPVFGHHGWPPHQQERLKHHFNDFDINAATAFFNAWFQFVKPETEILKELADAREWRKQQALTSWVLSGLAVLCDWVGSDQEQFCYYCDVENPMPLAEYWEKVALPTARNAISQIDVLPKALAGQLKLHELFPFIRQSTPLQKFCNSLDANNSPQLLILEDVTGAGKTEAALILAQHMMAQGHADGIYVGLPTMATANAMYERMVDTYSRLYEEQQRPSLILSHSVRHLSKSYQESLLAAKQSHDNYGSEKNIIAQCNQWLADNRKKALLADVGIGTIDQALLSVMPARHQSLRLLGLLNKILILDEVHAYDAYTSELMKTLIRFHAAFGGSTVLLSATLTRKQREEFIAAFHGEKYVTQTRTGKTDYPLLTQVTVDNSVTEKSLATRESVKRSVKVNFCHDEPAVLSLIDGKIAEGQCVCWIRNTVQDAAEAWQTLRDNGVVSAERLHLFHSRFALQDRLRIEKDMLRYFGKESGSEDRKGRILIATQVVEQSLDLDFDVMVSDLAPIDLLIQRAGRLQRHLRDASGERLPDGATKDQRTSPVLTILSPSLTDTPDQHWYKQLLPKANSVYPHTLVLWRTAQLLAERQGWSMPEDARTMLETVYGDEEDNLPELLASTTQKAIGEENAERDQGNFAVLSLEKGYKVSRQWDEEAKIATRLGDESQTIYLARWQDGVLSPWADKGRYHWDLSSLRVSVRQLETLAPIKDQELAAALQVLRNETKLFDEFSFILPLTPDQKGNWRGQGENQSGDPVWITYSQSHGLNIEAGFK